MLEQVRAWHLHIKEAIKQGKEFKLERKSISQIVFSGFGSSLLVGEIIKSILYEAKIPIQIIKAEEIPNSIAKDSLFFLISYSGNAGPIIELAQSAYKKGYKPIVLTSNGKLQELANKYNFQLISPPKDLSASTAICYETFLILSILHYNEIIKIASEEIAETVRTLSQHEELEGKANDLAERIGEKNLAVFSSEKNASLALHWKQSFNELAKKFTIANFFPNFAYGEILTLNRLNPKDWHFVIINDTDDSDLIKKQSLEIKNLLKKLKFDVTEIALKGRVRMSKILNAIFIGTLAAIKNAEKLDIDPSDDSLIREINSKI